MKRITKWNRFIYQHAVVVAMLYSFAIFIMVCLVSSLAWESADDFLISMILSGSFGEYSPYVLVLGYPVSAVMLVANAFTTIELVDSFGTCFRLEFFFRVHMGIFKEKK